MIYNELYMINVSTNNIYFYLVTNKTFKSFHNKILEDRTVLLGQMHHFTDEEANAQRVCLILLFHC